MSEKSISDNVIDLQFTSGNSFSASYNLQKKSIMSVYFPAGWDGGATVKIQTSLTYPTLEWKDVQDSDGNNIELSSVSADTVVTMANNELQALMQLKNIRLVGTQAVGANRIAKLQLKEV